MNAEIRNTVKELHERLQALPKDTFMDLTTDNDVIMCALNYMHNHFDEVIEEIQEEHDAMLEEQESE